MNVERIINMIVRRLMRKGINKGINAALGGASGQMSDGDKRQTKEARQAKQKMKAARRLM